MHGYHVYAKVDPEDTTKDTTNNVTQNIHEYAYE